MINTDQIVITREPYTTISTNKFHDKRERADAKNGDGKYNIRPM